MACEGPEDVTSEFERYLVDLVVAIDEADEAIQRVKQVIDLWPSISRREAVSATAATRVLEHLYWEWQHREAPVPSLAGIREEWVRALRLLGENIRIVRLGLAYEDGERLHRALRALVRMRDLLGGIAGWASALSETQTGACRYRAS